MTNSNVLRQPGIDVKEPTGSCRSCGGSAAPFWGRASGFTVCTRCGLVARNPMPSDDELAAMYAEHYNDENIRGQTTHMESSDVALKNHAAYITTHILADAMKILDFGAGPGTMVNLLRYQGCDIDGLEYSDNARAAARRLHQLDLLSNVAELRNAAYDAVLMIEVIEHLTDPPEVLRTLKQALKPGGVLYISTPNLNGLNARINKERWREAEKPSHLYLYNFSSLDLMLRNCGYSGVRFIRFSAMTSESPRSRAVHRLLQLMLLYGGLRVVAHRPA